ncbi:Crp/Fnr family transcriptional regulator [Spirosoma arcticum]
MQAGDVCRQLTFIESGLFRHYYESPKDEVTRWISAEGSFVSSLGSFINQTPTVENIQALEASVVYILDKRDFDALYARYESVREGWCRQIEQYYVVMEKRVHESVVQTAEARYVNLAREYPNLLHRVPLRYLASMLNSTPRHLSRIRRRLMVQKI